MAKSVCARISGDKMLLDTLFWDQDALILGHLLGSGPWLMMERLEGGVTPTANVMRWKEIELTVKMGQVVDLRAISRWRVYPTFSTLCKYNSMVTHLVCYPSAPWMQHPLNASKPFTVSIYPQKLPWFTISAHLPPPN